MNNSKRYIGLCELYHHSLHGFDDTSDPNINGNWIVSVCSIYNDNQNSESESESESDTESDTESERDEEDKISRLQLLFTRLQSIYRIYKVSLIMNSSNRAYLTHDFIRNYYSIIRNNVYMKPQIFQKIYLKGNECCAIIKTIWLKIVQRSWKRVFKERQKIIKMRMLPKNIIHWQTCGKWHDSCLYLPSIKGMIH
jgi:hypothetical protein